jgi:hypothetical protein
MAAGEDQGWARAAGHPRWLFATATRALNGGNRRHWAALSEFESPFLNERQRSVNRKVQGSNPWSGANCIFELASQHRNSEKQYGNRIETQSGNRLAMPLSTF